MLTYSFCEAYKCENAVKHIGNTDDAGFSLDNRTGWSLSLTIGSMFGPILVENLTHDVSISRQKQLWHTRRHSRVLSSFVIVGVLCLFDCVFVSLSVLICLFVYCVICLGVWCVRVTT